MVQRLHINVELANNSLSQRERMRVVRLGTRSGARARTSSLRARFWNQRTSEHRVRQFECESGCEPTRTGQATPCSHTQLVDPRYGCSKQLRDQEGTNSGHLDECNRSQNPRQTSQDIGFSGSATEQVAQTMLVTIENELETPTLRRENIQQQSVSHSALSNIAAAADTHVRNRSHGHISDTISGHTVGTQLSDANSCGPGSRYDGFRQRWDDGNNGDLMGDHRDLLNTGETTTEQEQAISQGNCWNW